MDPTQLQELARAIAYHTVLDTWPYWVTLVTLVVLGVVGGNYFASYAARRGEVQAAKDDRKEILEGIRKTTEATEEVRSAVALDEWTEREQRALRRTKLEELIVLAQKTRDWLYMEWHNKVYEEETTWSSSPQPTMLTIGTLYFPEIEESLDKYSRACHSLHSKILDVSAKISAARAEGGGNKAASHGAVMEIRKSSHPELLECYKSLMQSLAGLRLAAANLMKTIIAPPK